MERTIVAALVLSAFSLLVLHVLTNPQAPITHEKESFVNTNVTRASKCNCLPGYIPSSGADGKIYGGSHRGTIYYVPRGSKNLLYSIDSTNNCGIPIHDDYPYVMDWFNSNNITNQGQFNVIPLTCDILQKSNGGGGENYFCQKLGDPTVTRKCY